MPFWCGSSIQFSAELGSHCKRALASAPVPELSSTHPLATAPAPALAPRPSHLKGNMGNLQKRCV